MSATIDGVGGGVVERETNRDDSSDAIAVAVAVAKAAVTTWGKLVTTSAKLPQSRARESTWLGAGGRLLRPSAREVALFRE